MGQSSIEIGILQLEEEIKKSILEKNRTGDYRIGLRKAIDILANLKEMHKQEVIDAGDSCALKSIIFHDTISKKSESELLELLKEEVVTYGLEYYNETYNIKR